MTQNVTCTKTQKEGFRKLNSQTTRICKLHAKRKCKALPFVLNCLIRRYFVVLSVSGCVISFKRLTNLKSYDDNLAILIWIEFRYSNFIFVTVTSVSSHQSYSYHFKMSTDISKGDSHLKLPKLNFPFPYFFIDKYGKTFIEIRRNAYKLSKGGRRNITRELRNISFSSHLFPHPPLPF